MYFASVNLFVSFGLALFPRESLNSIQDEATTMDIVLRKVFEILNPKNISRIVMSSKRNAHFILRLSQVVKEIKSDIVVKMCYQNFQTKILQSLCKNVDKVNCQQSDKHDANFKEHELLFNFIKSLVFIPPQF